MSAQPDPSPTAPGSDLAVSVHAEGGAARWTLALLVVVYVFNFIDRQILTILLEDIKQELGLSDTALGFLSGFAFAALYSTLGIPIARWADRGVRRNIIALACLTWSGMTALTGLCQSFWQLSLARVGVGIGEAGCSPPAHSLISDYFPPERRATALSIYAAGVPIGGALGYFFGGWLGDALGWRLTFVAAGLPGIALALLVRATVPEPARGRYDSGGASAADRESVGDVFRFLLQRRSFVHLSIAAALHALYGYGAAAFIGVFMIRIHGFSKLELGTWLAAFGVTLGVLGTYLGGRLADRYGASDARWYVWVPGISTLIYLPFAFLFYLWPQKYVALACYAPAAVVSGMWLGPTIAISQTMARPQMRALSSALLFFIINLIGMGLGPIVVGSLSEHAAPWLGANSIRYAILSVVTVSASASALHYFLAARTLRADLAGTTPEGLTRP